MQNIEIESPNVPAQFFSFTDENGNLTTPWHGKNEILTSDPMDLEACLREAGQLYEVEKHALIDPIHGQPLKSVFGLYRSDNKAFINTCGAGFNGQGPHRILEPIHRMMQDQKIRIDSMAAWPDGLFAINYNIGDTAPVGDPHKNYFQVVFANNTRVTLTEFTSSLRMVCKNTVAHALNAATVKYRTKSTKNMLNRLDEAAVLVANLKGVINGVEEILTFLCSKKLSTDMVNKILTDMYGEVKVLKDGSTKDNIREKVMRAFEHNDGDLIPGIRGTAGNLYHAISEVHTHDNNLLRIRGEVEEGERNEVLRSKRAAKNLFGNPDIDKFVALATTLLK